MRIYMLRRKHEDLHVEEGGGSMRIYMLTREEEA